MFNKNLRFYRLQKGLTKKDLAERIGISSQAITNYENGSRFPDMDILQQLATALQVRVMDFLAVRDENLQFEHGDFRKLSRMPLSQQDCVRESVEEYFGRFFSIVEILGGEVLPESPASHSLCLTSSVETDAANLRQHLRLSPEGPVSNLVELLENKGVLFYFYQGENDFSGMSGFVANRPYIVINQNMSAERIRSTIVHELAHIMFDWPADMPQKEQEERATAISGSFLFPAKDVKRELGVRRNGISNDMASTAQEYGISMWLLAKRAQQCEVITTFAEKNFYVRASKMKWRTDEPSRIDKGEEQPHLFRQLVFRAVSEDEISPCKGAELLKISVDTVIEACHFNVSE